MKYFALLPVFAFSLCAQEFTTGQAARLLIGQPNFTAQRPEPKSNGILGGVSGIAYANDMLFVADSSRVGAGPDNNRVLLYKNLSSFIPRPTAEIPQINNRCPACVGEAAVVMGQVDFEKTDFNLRADGMRVPTSVHSDGTRVVVADTDFNRILIWNRIPDRNGVPADIVLGQNNFTTIRQIVVDNKSFRGPQGVWIQDNRLFVADTMNHRVLIWNRIPTANDTPADVVLGQANFNVAPQPDLTKVELNAQNNTLLNPVSVTSDGTRLYVTDLGHQRVLIWNRIPTSNQQAADVVLGQPDFVSATPNNSEKLCESDGTDDDGDPTYPPRCGATFDYPRYALSDGRRLFVADGGNDRILVWNSIPTQNGQKADVVLGQLSDTINNTSDSAAPDLVSASDTLRTPMGLAWDGTNLYVSDTFNRRIMVFTAADPKVPYTGVRNSASLEVFAVGAITFDGTFSDDTTDDEIVVTIGDDDSGKKEYKYKIVKDDSFSNIVTKFVDLINADGGDPKVLARGFPSLRQVQLTSKVGGEAGNSVAIAATVAAGSTSTVTATVSGATLTGGQNAARLAAGTLITITGERLTDGTAAAPEGAEELPRELAGVKVYVDGIQIPLMMVSPTQINGQLPWEVGDGTSSNAVVRTTRADGTVEVSSAVAIPIAVQNPGIFALPGTDPRPGIVYHGSSFATGTVSVDGSSKKDDTVTIVIRDRKYTYTVEETTLTIEDIDEDGDGQIDDEEDKEDDDTEQIEEILRNDANAKLRKIRDGLIAAINAGDGDPEVTASAAGIFTRIRLIARRPGPDLNGIPISAETSTDSQAILTATNSQLCCANVEGAPVTEENPAVPGETIIIYATGLGKILPEEAQAEVKTGQIYRGTDVNEPEEFVSSLAGAKTANVLFARLKPGTIGIYEVILELNSDLPTSSVTQLTIAQSFEVSNIVTFALKNLNDRPDVP
ncbi:MAG: hypothetical protein SFV18_03935 [Bryobacteraceae bacterium]|nr:hypothetical protein [Bryobacteraceae bacterium]